MRPEARALRFAVAVVVLGALATASAVTWVLIRDRTERAELVEGYGETLVGSAEHAVAEATRQLGAVAGLFRASEVVTRSEFRQFVDDIGFVAGMEGIGFVPVVPDAELESFLAAARDEQPGFRLWEWDTQGNPIPAASRDEYFPLLYFESPTDLEEHGFDAASHPRRVEAMNRARVLRQPSITSFVAFPTSEDPDVFVIYYPIEDPVSTEVTGFIAAPMDLSELLTQAVAPALHRSITWEIVDVTDDPTPTETGNGWSAHREIGGRVWRFTVSPGVGALTTATAEPLLILITGSLASLLAGAVLYLVRRRLDHAREIERLQELSAEKDRFLASVSHEVRTPLTGVLGFAELLRAGHLDMDPTEREQMIASVADQASDLTNIVEDLVVAARSELGKLSVVAVPVSLPAQVAQVVEAAGRDTCERVEIIDTTAGNRALGDPGRIRQVVRNLLSNACRYGGPRIEIRIFEDGGQFHLQVADDGPGLPSPDWERIFEPYYRVGGDASQPESLGIGLTIARQLASLLGGRLTYRHEDGWSVFELTLPSAARPKAVPVADSIHQPAYTG